LQKCSIRHCPPAVERSRFRQTINFGEHIAKGGKKDRVAGDSNPKAAADLGNANQFPFLEWLCTLTKGSVSAIINQAARIGLTTFEVQSLENIEWFQFLCQRSASPENYVDVFHQSLNF
jgi:hypothetical protein